MHSKLTDLVEREFICWAIREGKYKITCFNVGPTEEVKLGIPVEPKQESSGENTSYRGETRSLINPYSDIKGDDVNHLNFHLSLKHCRRN